MRIKTEAVTVLIALLERREKLVEDEKRLLFPFSYVPQLTAALQLSSGDVEKDYNFQKLLVRAATQLGERQIRIAEKWIHR